MMSEIKILEIVVCVMLVANVVGFGILFGKVDYLMSQHLMWFEDWIRKGKSNGEEDD